MKTRLLLLLIFLSVCFFSKAQLSVDYSFFKGDTLQGFDLNTAVFELKQVAARHHMTEREFKLRLYKKQKDFVAVKYRALLPNPSTRSTISGPISVLTSTCNNVDFEDGNFTGWVGAVGFNNNTLLPLTIASNGIQTLGLNSPETSCSYHTLVTAAAGKDPYSGLPMLDPGGGIYAVRIGGEFMNVESTFFGIGTCSTGDTTFSGGGGSGGEILQQTFIVTPSNNLFTYSYSVVMDQVNHSNGEQPFFRIELLDSTGAQTKTCDQFYVQEDSTGVAPKGFITSTVQDAIGDSVYYLPWTANSINLSPYMGKKITVRFTAAGCTVGGHFAYAYVDCACSPIHFNLSTSVSCTGTLTNIFAPPGAPGYFWTKVPAGPGIVGPTNKSTCQISQSGKYQVTITHGNCSYSIDTTLTFLPGPTYTSSVNNVLCNGKATGSASVVITGGAAPFSYSWSTVPTQSTASVNNITAGTYSVSVSSPNGCATDTILIIKQPPLLTLLPISPVTLCLSQSTSLSCVATGGVAPYTYSWTGPGGTAAVSPVAPTANTSYTVNASDANGCQSSSQQLIIHVNPPLVASASGAATLCPGTSASLSSGSSGGNNIYAYSWTPAAGLNNTAVQNPVATPVSSTTYTVFVTDGCGSPSDSATVSVNVIPNAPVPSFTSSDTVGCVKLCLNFNGSSVPPCVNAVWDFGDGSATGCGSVPHCYNKPGTYTVSLTVTDANGCIGSISKPNLILVNPLPVAAFSTSPYPVTLANANVSFTDLSSGAVSWSWQFGDSAKSFSVLQNPKFTFEDTGCYKVMLAIENTLTCKDTIRSKVCVQNEYAFYAANAFTPNGDGLNDIWLPVGTDLDMRDYELLIFNRWGDLVFSTNTIGKGWDGTTVSNGNAQVDTYVWHVKLKDLQGTRYTYTGSLNLIR
jgi:gliding motility-associated-like protein